MSGLTWRRQARINAEMALTFATMHAGETDMEACIDVLEQWIIETVECAVAEALAERGRPAAPQEAK